MDMHLFYFDIDTMKDILERNGFELVETTNYVHHISFDYLLDRGSQRLPAILRVPISFFRKMLPTNFIVPVSFGDIKLFVARKT